MTSDVMRILQAEGLICAEVVLGRDGKGFVRFEPDGDYEEVEANDALTAAESDQLAAEIRSAAGIETPREVDYGGCTAIGVAGLHSEEFGEENGRCNWCGLDGPIRSMGPIQRPHDRSCHCASCVPCRHHPGVDCGCYCRFTSGCTEACSIIDPHLYEGCTDGGLHSGSFGQPDGECDWCGERGPLRSRA